MTCMIFLFWLVTSASVAMATFLYRAICLLFIFCSLITWRVQYSRPLSSAMTPSYKSWSASCESIARFNPTPFKALTVGLSASFSVVITPSSNTCALEAFVHNISSASDVLIAKLVDSVPACDVWVCNSCSLVWMAPRRTCFYFSNCLKASAVTSLTMSPMSYKSPSINVMGSNDVLVALDLFLDPPFSSSLRRLMRPDVS